MKRRMTEAEQMARLQKTKYEAQEAMRRPIYHIPAGTEYWLYFNDVARVWWTTDKLFETPPIGKSVRPVAYSEADRITIVNPEFLVFALPPNSKGMTRVMFRKEDVL